MVRHYVPEVESVEEDVTEAEVESERQLRFVEEMTRKKEEGGGV
jgi:hypothetical protein